MKRYIRSNTEDSVIEAILFCEVSHRDKIIASILSAGTPIFSRISSRDITRSMVRVKSSNIWAYTINVKDAKSQIGDVYVQFKGPTGGAGDVYVLYDVPVRVYRKWITAPSKGHYYWQYLRDNYKYSKLTGDKRGKLKNAINH